MLYYLFDYLAQFNSGFDVFHYLTLRIILSALTALVLSLMLGPIIINYLNNKKLYQSIREDGPKSHITNKSQTPSMGGLIIIISIILSTLLWSDIFNKNIWILAFILILSTLTSPLVIGSKPRIISIKVLFHDPLLPMKPIVSPLLI